MLPLPGFSELDGSPPAVSGDEELAVLDLAFPRPRFVGVVVDSGVSGDVS